MTDLQQMDTLIERLRRLGIESSSMYLLGRLREGVLKRRLHFAEDHDNGRPIFWVGTTESLAACVPRHPEPVRALHQAVRAGGRAVSVSHLAAEGERQRNRIAERIASARDAVRRSSAELASELDSGIRVERSASGYAIRFISRALIDTDIPPANSNSVATSVV